MRRSLYASGGLHLAVIGWAAVASWFSPANDPEPFEVTGVTILTTGEYEALVDGSRPAAPEAVEEVQDLAALATPDVAPDLPQPEAPPPETAEVPETAAPAPDEAPVTPETPPAPEIELLPDRPNLPQIGVPPQSDPNLPQADRPVPQDAPRIASVPTPTPPPDVEVAPAPLPAPTPDPAPAEVPVEEPEPAAPEEATTETVTEAEEPATASLAPTVSIRPAPRPERLVPPEPDPVQTVAADSQNAARPDPQPEETAAETTPPDTSAAINDLLAGIVADEAPVPDPGPSAPQSFGASLTPSEIDGLRRAVGGCWNLSRMSVEAQRTTITVAFSFQPSGRVVDGSVRLLGFTGGSQASADIAFEVARSAIYRCAADAELPQGSFARWENVEITFNPDQMRLR